jgi:iron-regulated transporter 1
MRRIDLICKLAGPFVIALIDGISTEIAIVVNLGMNVASVVVEYYAIARVCHESLYPWGFY